jgi:hypothetical protein
VSISKNFVIKHGFEVSTDLILADADTRRVGIASTNPQYTLDVAGDIGAKNIVVSGVGTFSTLESTDVYINSGIITSLISNDGIIDFLSGTNLNYTGISSFSDIKGVNQEITGIATFNSLQIDGNLSVGGTTGQQDQILISTGTGVTWKDSDNIRTTTSFIATTGQTNFSVSYSIGYVDVYINGVKLSNIEFTATDGSTIILNDPCFGEEIVEIIAYSTGFPLAFTGITIQKEGFTVGTGISAINFVGASVTAVSAGSGATIFVDNYWTEDSSNIYAFYNVGIGTTNPTSALTVEGDGSFSGTLTSSSFIVIGGSSTEFLKADGSIDSNTYLTSTDSGENLTGIVTSILSGSGISIDQSTGEVTISSTIDSYWESSLSGIHTLSNVGIGTTNPTSALTVEGDGSFSGIVTATGGFISVGNTTPIQISLEGDQLTFIAVGIGSTTLTLF